MSLGIHSPLPSSLALECKKCGKILASFIDPKQAFGPDKVIPPSVLANAKGLAIITVFKAAFLGSGRYGNGIVIARLDDGTWSAPSSIGLEGVGFGGQIGFELTDFVFVLNDASAVRAFSQQGSVTLGGNVSLAAGPVGRNAEAAGAASLKGVAGVFSYSKTKGMFMGVSLECSVVVERRDANERFYGKRYTASQLMEGCVRPPPAAASLMSVLCSRDFEDVGDGDNVMYNDIPKYDSDDNYSDEPKRANTWADDVYDRPAQGGIRKNTRTSGFDDDYTYSDTSSKAVALFTLDGDQPGDLRFKKGDIITVTQKTDKTEDWWTGKIGTREGIFPRNYVEMKK